MKTRLSVRIGQRLIAGILGLSAALIVLSHPASAQAGARFKLTSQQDAAYAWAQTASIDQADASPAASVTPPCDPSAGLTGLQPIAPIDPNALTALADDGRIIQDRPDGNCGHVLVGAPSSPPAEVDRRNPEDLNTPGNARDRTGGDGGKNDKGRENNSSGGSSRHK